jgi:hypothetical protein
MNAPPEFRDFC